MAFPILGLHHVTATVDDAQADLNFAKSALGLRLVKKTVNFDNHSVYHFYYGDGAGTPGTIWTTFPYRGKGVPSGVHGAGQITATAFSVPSGALGFWTDRLSSLGYHTDEPESSFGQTLVSVVDPSGLVIELVAVEDDKRRPWTGGGVSSSNAIRGLHSVTMTVRDAARSVSFMQHWLGYSVTEKSGSRTRVSVNGGRTGSIIEVLESRDAPAAKNGLGTVHHVAMAIEEPAEQLRLRRELIQAGIQVTPVMDRQYFQSIYFREPGGILYEVATIKPGFAVDEPMSGLGLALKLPPDAEPQRAEIERQLPAVVH